MRKEQIEMIEEDTVLDEKEYILRGGFIGSLFFVIYFFIVNYLPGFEKFPCMEETNSFFNCFGIPLFQGIGKPASFVITNVGFLDNMGTTAQGIFAIVFLLAFYFVIGSALGYIYWKIKVRGKDEN